MIRKALMDKNEVVNRTKEFGEFDEFSTVNRGFGFSICADSRDWRAIAFEV